jgi:glycosyltransferase involved in cell wall biosynthesis
MQKTNLTDKKLGSPVMETNKQAKIAVLIPCYNEEAAVGKVIDDFKQQLPDADIIVFNNNSTDQTDCIAR